MSSDEDLNENHYSENEFKEIKITNPFLRDRNFWDSENELFDKFKVNIEIQIHLIHSLMMSSA